MFAPGTVYPLKRRLGRTGLPVSAIALGTVELGLDYGPPGAADSTRPTEPEAARLLARALDLGVNFIDTARAYGESEAIIGRALKSRRGEFVLCSKVQPLPRAGLVVASVHESLRALQTDVIDILMVHSRATDATVPEEVFGALERLRERGAVRFLGASVYGEQPALAALGSGLCDCLEIAYSALDRRPEARVLAAAERADAGVVARSVLLKGALTHRWRGLPDALATIRRAAEKMESAAAGCAGGVPELAYRYVLGHAGVHTALAGTARIGELEAALRYAERGPLPLETLNRVREISVEDEDQLSPACWT